jgi:hypothetical protein
VLKQAEYRETNVLSRVEVHFWGFQPAFSTSNVVQTLLGNNFPWWNRKI